MRLKYLYSFIKLTKFGIVDKSLSSIESLTVVILSNICFSD